MENPFELINARLSNIESLLLDIKHQPLGEDVEQGKFKKPKQFLSQKIDTLPMSKQLQNLIYQFADYEFKKPFNDITYYNLISHKWDFEELIKYRNVGHHTLNEFQKLIDLLKNFADTLNIDYPK